MTLRKIASTALLAVPVIAAAAVAGVAHWKAPDLGGAPEQPVAFSHARHAGTLGMDCRFCHVHTETAASAGMPPTATCVACHGADDEAETSAPIRKAWADATPIRWTRVQRLSDTTRYDHAIHSAVGVGCEVCHGRVDQMERTAPAQIMNEAFCVGCHTAPAQRLRPAGFVTRMGDDTPFDGETFVQQFGIEPPLHCSGCHQ